MEIILIDIGVFQPYILDNIKNLRSFGNNNITVITEPHLICNFKNVNTISANELELFGFDSNNKLPIGFWANCSKRLFLLYSYMKKYNKTNCIHIENDYLIYFSTDEIKDLNEKVWLTMDSPDRCIPGIILIPNYNTLEPLIKKYDFKNNDMVNMGKYYNNNKNLVGKLPILNNYPYFEKWNMIFDAAAIGQYLGGIDTIHHNGGIPGFVNETCVIDYSKYKFSWVKNENLYIPMINIEEKLYKIAGLHIHSKRLFNFQAEYPKEENLIKFQNSEIKHQIQ